MFVYTKTLKIVQIVLKNNFTVSHVTLMHRITSTTTLWLTRNSDVSRHHLPLLYGKPVARRNRKQTSTSTPTNLQNTVRPIHPTPCTQFGRFSPTTFAPSSNGSSVKRPACANCSASAMGRFWGRPVSMPLKDHWRCRDRNKFSVWWNIWIACVRMGGFTGKIRRRLWRGRLVPCWWWNESIRRYIFSLWRVLGCVSSRFGGINR